MGSTSFFVKWYIPNCDTKVRIMWDELNKNLAEDRFLKLKTETKQFEINTSLLLFGIQLINLITSYHVTAQN